MAFNPKTAGMSQFHKSMTKYPNKNPSNTASASPPIAIPTYLMTVKNGQPW